MPSQVCDLFLELRENFTGSMDDLSVDVTLVSSASCLHFEKGRNRYKVSCEPEIVMWVRGLWKRADGCGD